MTLQLRGTGFFGKLPTAGDFQKALLADGPDSKVLQWFTDGWARYALAGGRPDPQIPIHFVWQRPGTPTAFLGSMLASRDRSGRRFPLMAFGAVTGMRTTATILGCCRGFLDRAVAVLDTGRSGLDTKALLGHVESLRTALDPDGWVQQADWEATTSPDQWAAGVGGGAAARLRAIEFAFSNGGTPNFVLRGRWQGDLRHLTAGIGLLQHLGKQPPAMLFWSESDGAVSWRMSFDYAIASQFEGLMWHEASSGSAFDTDPGVVTIPDTFVIRQVTAVNLSTLLAGG